MVAHHAAHELTAFEAFPPLGQRRQVRRCKAFEPLPEHLLTALLLLHGTLALGAARQRRTQGDGAGEGRRWINASPALLHLQADNIAM